MVAVILPVLAGYFMVKYFWFEPFDPAKFGINISENTKRPNEDNKTYLTRLMKNAICRLILKTLCQFRYSINR